MAVHARGLLSTLLTGEGTARPFIASEAPTTSISDASEAGDDPLLRARLDALCAEGWAIWDAFDRDVRERTFHAFVAADYGVVREALLKYRATGPRFLEWGSASGVITIMADLLGLEACGIEIDDSLVAMSRDLARRFESRATFAAGSFLPTGYEWQNRDGDRRTGTLGSGPSGYLQLGRALDDFDIVYGFPWEGEEALMLDVMKRYGRPGALLLLHGVNTGVTPYRDGRALSRVP